MKVEGLDRLCIAVPNLEEGKALFGKILGLEFEFSGEAALPGGPPIKIALSNQGVELIEVPGKEMHLRSFHFKVNDLAEAKDWVQQNGVKITNEFSVGQMAEVALDLNGLRTILINYPGTDPAAAARGEAQK